MSKQKSLSATNRFLDNAVSRGSEIDLETPLDEVKADSFYEHEIRYLTDRSYIRNSAGTQ